MKFIPTIGLEVHAQLNTKSKIFCSCPTSFGEEPNRNTCPVCLGLPGALPVFNREVLTKAVLAAMATNCTLHGTHYFDRKNYFYPDLPKAYQISQFHYPYSTGGHLDIVKENGEKKRIGITRIHMEEDAGKLVHSENPAKHESYIDLNRAGTPLVEIVSDPVIDDSEEAYLYLTKLKSILRYVDVSDCNMEQGSLRCDANVSIRPEGTEKLGTRTEIKNLNSFKAVRAAIDYEIERQKDVLLSGGRITQETRLWNADRQETVTMRSKEEAHDYRYFRDPDLPILSSGKNFIASVRTHLPELADQKAGRYQKEFALSEYDALVLSADRGTAEYFEAAVSKGAPAKKASNWIQTEMLGITREKDCELTDLFPADHLSELILEIEAGTISGKIAKTVFQKMLERPDRPKVIIEKEGLVQISDTGAISAAIEKVVAENSESVQSIRDGKEKAFGFLVGQIMKETRGKANPQLVNEMLRARLKE